MFPVEAAEVVVGNLHELGCLALITVGLLQGTLYKACLEGILCLVKAIKGKVVEGKRLLGIVACI